MDELQSQILEFLCAHHFDMRYGYLPISSINISKNLGITSYRTRKALKALKEKGFVKAIRTYAYDLSGDDIGLASGYCVTTLVKDTDEYQRTKQKEIDVVKKIYDWDISETLDKDWVD